MAHDLSPSEPEPRPRRRAAAGPRASAILAEASSIAAAVAAKPRGQPAAKRPRKSPAADADGGYAYEWRPPPRRERGSRSLGESVEPEQSSAFVAARRASGAAGGAGARGGGDAGFDGTTPPAVLDPNAPPLSAAALEAARGKAGLDAVAEREARAALDSLRTDRLRGDVKWDESRLAMIKVRPETNAPRSAPPPVPTTHTRTDGQMCQMEVHTEEDRLTKSTPSLAPRRESTSEMYL